MKDYQRRLEIGRHRWYLGQHIQLALDELPPHNTRWPRPKVQIDALIQRIRTLNAPIKERLAALEELDAG